MGMNYGESQENEQFILFACFVLLIVLFMILAWFCINGIRFIYIAGDTNGDFLTSWEALPTVGRCVRQNFLAVYRTCRLVAALSRSALYRRMIIAFLALYTAHLFKYRSHRNKPPLYKGGFDSSNRNHDIASGRRTSTSPFPSYPES